jgi:glucose-1-phosphate thymidylyltransferase
MLQFLHQDGVQLVADSALLQNSTIIAPCFIGEDVQLINSTVGPNVSLGKGCHVSNSTMTNSLVQNHSHIKNAKLDNAMIGSHAAFNGEFTSISIGDYSVLE